VNEEFDLGLRRDHHLRDDAMTSSITRRTRRVFVRISVAGSAQTRRNSCASARSRARSGGGGISAARAVSRSSLFQESLDLRVVFDELPIAFVDLPRNKR
jgi:hypothetical protein